MQDEVAKAIIEKSNDPPSVSKHETLITQIKSEVAQAHANVLQSMTILPKSMYSLSNVNSLSNYLENVINFFI